ncbi:MAG: hypothetical protein P1S46_05675 [bacterium]|nr:hypothetical protein [bacterium]
MARDLISEGQYGKAVSLLEETVGQSPEGSEGFYLLGVARLWTGDCDAAFEKFRRALEPDVILHAGLEDHTGRWGSPGKVTLTTRGTWTGVDWSRKDDLVRSR